MAKAEGVSKTTVHRWFSLFAHQASPGSDLQVVHRPLLYRKVRDIVGLYLNPPDHAMVLWSTSPGSGPSRRCLWVSDMSNTHLHSPRHDDVVRRPGHRHRFIAQCKKRHRHQDFLRLIDREVPAALDIHLVVDYATHRHAKVKAWLAKRLRYHLHFTPTYASWLNQVERWFGLISQRAIKRASFP